MYGLSSVGVFVCVVCEFWGGLGGWGYGRGWGGWGVCWEKREEKGV